jgi:hypothetical protein
VPEPVCIQCINETDSESAYRSLRFVGGLNSTGTRCGVHHLLLMVLTLAATLMAAVGVGALMAHSP